jgi:hypothetical protein
MYVFTKAKEERSLSLSREEEGDWHPRGAVPLILKTEDPKGFPTIIFSGLV